LNHVVSALSRGRDGNCWLSTFQLGAMFHCDSSSRLDAPVKSKWHLFFAYPSATANPQTDRTAAFMTVCRRKEAPQKIAVCK